MSDGIDDPYPFESDDDLEIGELDLESVDAFEEARITVGELVGESESWRFGHVIVDEAQDLTPMQWRMIMRRVVGRSLTIVGDLAQSSLPVSERDASPSWSDRLPSELADIERLDLTINYRSPAEIHALAVEVLAAYAPDVAPSRPIRSSGFEPVFRPVSDVAAMATAIEGAVDELRAEVAGQIAVIGRHRHESQDDVDAARRVRHLRADEVKGLEFDAVVLVEPLDLWQADGGAALLYIALTRATQRLIVLHAGDLPAVLTRGASG